MSNHNQVVLTFLASQNQQSLSLYGIKRFWETAHLPLL